MHDHDEETEARRLLAPLAGEPALPSAIDLGRAMADGRRRRRNRRVAGVVAVAVVTALAAAGVPAALDLAPDGTTSGMVLSAPPTECEPERLPVPDGGDHSITAGDHTGRYLLDYLGPLLWVDGRLTEWDHPYQTEIFGELVVNSSGTIAGSAVIDERGFAWVYEDGRFTELPTPPGGKDAVVIDINERGDILGELDYRADGLYPPVIWPASDRGSVRELPMPDGYQADHLLWAVAIDDDQTVVGTQVMSTKMSRALLWSPDGTVSELPVPEEFGPDHTSYADDIRAGWILGRVYDPAAGTSGVTRWHLPSGEISIGSGLSEAQAINAQGWLAGTIGDNQFDKRPAIEVDGRVVELPYPTGTEPQVTDWQGVGADVISDDGRFVAGNVLNSDRRVGYIAVRWLCHS
jgi:hypothetical protein